MHSLLRNGTAQPQSMFMSDNPPCSVFSPNPTVLINKTVWTWERNGCRCWRMFHRAVLADKGLLLAFHKSFQALFLEHRLADLSATGVFLCYPIISQCVCSVFYSKSPWEARAFAAGVVGKISWLVLMFCCVSWGQAGLIPMLFVWGVLPNPQLNLPPPLLQRYFFRSGAWSGANSNRDLPVCPLSALTPAGVAFFTDSQHTGSWKLTDRQAGRV